MFLSTGKSKAFAHLLNEVFLHGFDSKVICMEDYRVTDIENEQCVLVVASTFGNGEPPDNGQVRNDLYIYIIKAIEKRFGYGAYLDLSLPLKSR